MSLQLMTSHVVVELIRHCCWAATMVRGLIFHRLAMLDEFEPEMSAHKSVVRSSNRPEGISLLIQVTFNPSKNLIHSRKRIKTYAGVGHCRQLSMHTKALRAES